MDKLDYSRGLFSKGTKKVELPMTGRAQVGQADLNCRVLEPVNLMKQTEARQVRAPNVSRTGQPCLTAEGSKGVW